MKNKSRIVTFPSEILRKRSAEVDPKNKKAKDLISRMVLALRNEEIGVGLSAPQLGKNLQIVVIEAREIKNKTGEMVQKAIPLSIFLNPKITKMSKEKKTEEEGCLSCPSYYGPVERSLKIRVECLDEKGNFKKINASGLLARIIQHEVDHLNGILFIDRVVNKKDIKQYLKKDDREF